MRTICLPQSGDTVVCLRSRRIGMVDVQDGFKTHIKWDGIIDTQTLSCDNFRWERIAGIFIYGGRVERKHEETLLDLS